MATIQLQRDPSVPIPVLRTDKDMMLQIQVPWTRVCHAAPAAANLRLNGSLSTRGHAVSSTAAQNDEASGRVLTQVQKEQVGALSGRQGGLEDAKGPQPALESLHRQHPIPPCHRSWIHFLEMVQLVRLLRCRATGHGPPLAEWVLGPQVQGDPGQKLLLWVR